MRLYQLDLMQFDIDQVKQLDSVLHFTQTGQVPLTGGLVLSTGMNSLPLVTLFLALPVLFTHSALWIAAFQAAIDALGALVVYAAVRQFSTRFAALAAGLFYAVLPAALVNSRLISNEGLVPALCAVALWQVLRFLKTGAPGSLAWSLATLGLATELHLTAAIFLPILLFAGMLRPRSIDCRLVGSAAGALILLALPYAYFEAQTGFTDVRLFAGFLGSPKHADFAALDVAALVAAGSVQDFFSLALPNVFGWLILAIILVGLLVTVRRAPALGAVLALWLALPIAVTIRHAESLAPHYFYGLLAPCAMLVGLGLAALRPRALGAGLLSGILVLRVGGWLDFQHQLTLNNLPGDHSIVKRYTNNDYLPPQYVAPYNVPLRYELQALAAASRAGSPVYLGPREDYDQVFRFLSDGRLSVVGLSGRRTTLLPKDEALLMLDGAGDNLEWPLQHFGSPVGTIASSSAKPFYSFSRLDPGWLVRFNASLALAPMDTSFPGGLRLTGLSLSPLIAGQPSKLLLEWQPAQQLSQAHLFAHLVDAAGKPWSSDPDSDVFAGTEWSDGARVLSETELMPASDVSTGGYFLELGLYDGATGIRLPVNGAGTELRLGPLKVHGISPALPAAPPKAIFGPSEIALDDVQLSGDTAVLTWSALSKPRAGYTVFVHALDANGRVIAQHDGPPVDGSYPASLWDVGEVVHDAHQLQGSLVGATKLEIGLYTQPGLQRLPLTSPATASAFEMPLPA